MARVGKWVWLGGGTLLTAAAVAGFGELRSSRLQSALWSASARAAGYRVEPGPSAQIRFPHSGPYDARLGYSTLPQYIERLQAQGFVVASQARQSPQLLALGEQGLFIPYREKSQAGLSLRDCRGEPLLALRLPQRQYASFAALPPLLVQSLLFIEDRHLLDPDPPRRNPALDPERFGKAALQQLQRRLDADAPAAGGSTLATQIEKYRHSPQGRTGSVAEKLRQMASASQRAYLDGEQTLPRRRQILLDYLNTVPLAARPGVGEVHGLGDGLWAWYGREFEDFNQALQGGGAAQALAYKQALSLLIAQRRPAQFLQGRGEDLRRLADSYLRLLAGAGVIPAALRDAALPLALPLAEPAPQPQRPDFVARKATNSLRIRLAELLALQRHYDLDRLDLEVHTSLDGRAQALATAALAGLHDPAAAQAAGLYGPHLLEAGASLRPLVFSLTLYERGARANWLRVQADNIDQPFDVNLGAKLDLGSTAKLRTLISYLEIVAELHARWAGLSAAELRALAPERRDALSLWARQYLLQARQRELPVMLEAALQRSYPASPAEAFFTGGGLHRFENFEHEHDEQRLTVQEAFKHSVNLVFIRLMRDIVQHRIYGDPARAAAALLREPEHPRRQALLAQFAAAEGGSYLAGFYRKYQGLAPAQADARLLADARPTLASLASLLFVLEPQADEARLRAWLDERLPRGWHAAPGLYARYRDMSLADRGYLTRIHPLELWLFTHLRQHPDASLAAVLSASGAARQQAYAWLFKPRQRAAQDQRLRQMLEREAFDALLQSWRRLGYPFDRLTPSYASAIGASGDRPAALAELMGILVNQGRRLPQQPIAALHFASATPFDTRLQPQPAAAQPLLAPAVVEAVHRALLGVVEDGTARRLKGVFLDAQGRVLPVGGKTGTGDHRDTRTDRAGRLVSERIVERSGTLVFALGERYFGSITSYVHEPDAARYRFTSALSVQLLKALGPGLLDSLQRQACPSR